MVIKIKPDKKKIMIDEIMAEYDVYYTARPEQTLKFVLSSIRKALCQLPKAGLVAEYQGVVNNKGLNKIK